MCKVKAALQAVELDGKPKAHTHALQCGTMWKTVRQACEAALPSSRPSSPPHCRGARHDPSLQHALSSQPLLSQDLLMCSTPEDSGSCQGLPGEGSREHRPPLPVASPSSVPQGKDCTVPINTCIQSPCLHGGTCHLSESHKDGFRYKHTQGLPSPHRTLRSDLPGEQGKQSWCP